MRIFLYLLFFVRAFHHASIIFARIFLRFYLTSIDFASYGKETIGSIDRIQCQTSDVTETKKASLVYH